MDKTPQHIRTLNRKRRIRQVLAGLVIFLVFLGGISAGLLLHRGILDSLTPDDAQRANPLPPQTLSPVTITKAPLTVDSTAPTEAESTPPTEDFTIPPEVDTVQAIMDTMTLEEKIYQLFVVTPEALTGNEVVTTAEDRLADDLLRFPVGGIVLFGQNLQTREQTTALISAHQSFSRIPLFVAVDEEGGAVSRLGSNPNMDVTPFPPMGEIEGLSDAYHVGLTLGSELSALGFNLDFAPVADINSNPENPIIGDRSFGHDAGTVSQLLEACVSGFQESGLMCTLKHFPGHGDTTEDSHLGYASSNATLDSLRTRELLPFSSGIAAGAPVIMVGHISLPKITGDNTPASLSPVLVTDLLRTELGFTGLIITDAMNMGAITENHSSGDAAVLAIAAGCDLILMPEDLPQAAKALHDAVEAGIIPADRIDESVRRILAMKLAYGILGDQF